MGVIIGAGTTASVGSACAISASWNASSQAQRLYCLNGTGLPVKTINKSTQTANMTVYSPGPSYPCPQDTTCQTYSPSMSATISPSACGGSAEGLSGSFYVTGYSFSKDDTTIPGQESWSLVNWIGTTPTHILRGVAEGQGTSNSGITFTGETSSAFSGNVSAGGLGRGDAMTVGQVISVGGGSAGADTGAGSASIPYTPLWLD